MLKSIKVRDYITRNLVTFRPEMNLFTAINRLLEHRISGAPVVDGQGHLVGLLSEGDCLRGILSGAYYESAGGDVSAYMTTEVEVISPEADIIEISERFLRGRRRRLPVVESVLKKTGLVLCLCGSTSFWMTLSTTSFGGRVQSDMGS